MRARRLNSGLSFVLVVSLAACDSTGVVCTTEARAGLAVTVTDSLSAGPLMADSLSLVAREGSFRDSIRVPVVATRSPISMVAERAGSYSLEVMADGYAPWSNEGFTVRSGECHVETVAVEVLLRPVT
jgi:hypothetical protein